MPAQRIVKLRREEEERKNDHQDLTRREDFAVEAEADDDKTATHPSYVVRVYIHFSHPKDSRYFNLSFAFAGEGFCYSPCIKNKVEIV